MNVQAEPGTFLTAVDDLEAALQSEPPAEVCEVGICDIDVESRAVGVPALLPTCPIGKFRGKPWSEVDGGFLEWMLRQADMAADLKWNADREISRRMGAA